MSPQANLLDESADFAKGEAGESNSSDTVNIHGQLQLGTQYDRNGRDKLGAGKGKGRMSPELEAETELGANIETDIYRKQGGNGTRGHGEPAQETDSDTQTPGEEVQLETSEQQEKARLQRRENALRKERDELAHMNTLLEHALLGLESAIPKVEVRLAALGLGLGKTAHKRARPMRTALLEHSGCHTQVA